MDKKSSIRKRSRQASQDLINLTDYYTASLDEDWLGKPGASLAVMVQRKMENRPIPLSNSQDRHLPFSLRLAIRQLPGLACGGQLTAAFSHDLGVTPF